MKYERTISLITYGIIFLAGLSCLITILYNEGYNDGPWIEAQWLGQDLVTLVFVVPVLWLSQAKGQGSRIWKMVRCGLLFYFVYTYAFFMFAAELSWFYFFHLPIFSMAGMGFFLSLSDLLYDHAGYRISNTWVRPVIIGYFIIITAMVAFLWLSQIFNHLNDPGFRSTMPDGKPPMIIYSLDLAIVLPLMVIAAIGYWRGTITGLILTAVMLVKTSTLGLALMAMAASMYLQDLSTEFFLVILWCMIGLVGGLLAFLYLRQLEIGDMQDLAR